MKKTVNEILIVFQEKEMFGVVGKILRRKKRMLLLEMLIIRKKIRIKKFLSIPFYYLALQKINYQLNIVRKEQRPNQP